MLACWLARRTGCKPVTLALEFGVIRQFCLFRQRHDPGSFVPDRTWSSQGTTSHFLPHVFTNDEVLAMLRAAQDHPGRNVSSDTLRAFLLVLYCTGLRLGEAARLQLEDVDLQRNLFHVRESKGKTRIVPFGVDLSLELSSYLYVRGRFDVGHNTFFVRRCGQPLEVYHASQAIRRLLRQLGLKPARGRTGPRPYDFRHTFAVHRLTQWYKDGVHIHARLPWLSAYMGHENVLGTETYLHATPELMAVASERFDRLVRVTRSKR
jgi:integrase